MCNFILEEENVTKYKGKKSVRGKKKSFNFSWLQYIRGMTNHINTARLEINAVLAEIGGLSG